MLGVQNTTIRGDSIGATKLIFLGKLGEIIILIFIVFLESQLYDLLLSFVLTEEELFKNGFPLRKDGKYSVFHDPVYAFNKKWKLVYEAYDKGLRFCVRCNTEYEVKELNIQSKLGCSFHSERKRTSRGES